ncbi:MULTISPECIES: hypothetical protein [Halobacteriovorax]|uniref:Uncharacterized protein n=1 Tax=Halobacteriovorax vibrionivorans TaxID=2152716 RepID=A0ABY0IIJ1_9BACT|nr:MULTISPECIES: hypothetical protein [Halobacteriovorax]RZF22763.1 hypothetical protein DAY19_03030 [Halobacteriovorax vibrionivorans]TGD46199.1 hypothetical protein EP118_13045 [Halobacteriovorax sp. Y22]
MRYILLLIPFFAFANVTSELVTGADRKLFSYTQVCEFFGVKDALLASKESSSKIDCMGKSFEISNFCEKKYTGNLNYTKARFDLVDGKIACHFSDTVILELVCKGKYSKFCKNTNESCNELKSEFAHSLDLSTSMILEIYPPRLKCFFQSKSKIPNSTNL